MALAERSGSGSEAEPIWEHPTVPFLQLTHLDIETSTGGFFRLYSHIDDGSGYFGLYLTRIDAPEQLKLASGSCIFRTRVIEEFPLGTIQEIVCERDGPNAILRASMLISGRRLSLLAAEVEEKVDGSLRIVEGDESILCQTDGIRPK